MRLPHFHLISLVGPIVHRSVAPGSETLSFQGIVETNRPTTVSDLETIATASCALGRNANKRCQKSSSGSFRELVEGAGG